MSFRGATIYVQGQTRHRLTLLARVVPAVPRGPGVESTQMTADELADSLLNEAMLTKFPQLGPLEKQIKLLEDAAAESIRKEAA
jgi:hypothetical protein